MPRRLSSRSQPGGPHTPGFTHLGGDNLPGMVDVSGKEPTDRSATAQALVFLPPEVLALFENGDLQSPKGPVFHTAIVAGTQGAKRTGDLIPFCHPVGLEDCKIVIDFNGKREARIRCTAKVRHRTGVEMEALTGAGLAALTLYDMCKSVSRGIRIRELRLLEKRGGKSDWRATKPAAL